MQRDELSNAQPKPVSRRDFVKWGGTLAAGSALAGVAIPHVHAGEDNTIRLALIGCGGRGSGAVGNAMNSSKGPVKLVAMADLVESRPGARLRRIDHCRGGGAADRSRRGDRTARSGRIGAHRACARSPGGLRAAPACGVESRPGCDPRSPRSQAGDPAAAGAL